MRKILVSILLLLSSITLPAQSPQVGWETLYAQLLEQDDEAGQSDEETYELLSELAEHPIVLNQATREDLERIPFLSETQIEELIAYITQYHGMRTMGELSLIESLDGLRRALLPYFLLLTDDETTHFPSLHTILQRGRHTVVGQVGVPFYDRQGDHEGFFGAEIPPLDPLHFPVRPIHHGWSDGVTRRRRAFLRWWQPMGLRPL